MITSVFLFKTLDMLVYAVFCSVFKDIVFYFCVFYFLKSLICHIKVNSE